MKNYISRRTLLRLGAGSLAVCRLGRLDAAVNSSTPNYKARLCVFLFWVHERCKTLLQIQTNKNNYSDYFAVRGNTLGLAQNTLATIAASGNQIYGLHPQLQPLQALYAQNRLALVANVGMLVRPITKAQYSQGTV